MEYKKAFTLAETLIVLVVLGIVASLTIPALVRRQIEAANRVKIKKAMGVYETMLAKIAVENDIKSNTALKEWGEQGGECANQRNYFKAVKGGGCQFMTADKVWWDVTYITHPKIALKEGELDTDSKTTFQLLGHFGPNGELRVNDIQWEISSNDNLTDEEKEELVKLFEILNGASPSNLNTKTKIPISSDYSDSQWEKYLNGDFDKSCSLEKVSCSVKIGSRSIKNGGAGQVYNDDGLMIFMQSTTTSMPTPKFRNHRGFTKTLVYNDNKELLYEKWVSLDGDNDIMCKNSESEEIDCPQ